MSHRALIVDREQILAYRRSVGELGARLPTAARSLRRIAWAGLQDSMPRAAVLSVNARMDGTDPEVWEHAAYTQVWGPRYSVFVVPERDVGVFTLGRLPEDAKGRARAFDTAHRLAEVLGGGAMQFSEAGRALGVQHNSLRYATTTGTVRLRWDGARQPTVWVVDPPPIGAEDAREELARRYLHIYGPATAESFAAWAGIRPTAALATFDSLRRSLTGVTTPIGDAWILTRDVDVLRSSDPEPCVRLLPSGDAYYLLQGEQRELLVPQAKFRDRLWTSRVWPGAVLVDGDVVGTWRRSKDLVSIELWHGAPDRLRDRIAAEAAGLPIPGVDGELRVEFGA